MDLTAAALPASLIKPLPAPTNASTFKGMDETAKRAQIDSKSKEYEQSFLSIMFGQMFQGTTRTLFGGGEGEEAFTGFLTDAMAKQVERHGGIGLAKNLSAEMLKLQGLAAKPTAQPPTAAVGATPSPTTAAASATPVTPASVQSLAPKPALKPLPKPVLDIAA